MREDAFSVMPVNIRNALQSSGKKRKQLSVRATAPECVPNSKKIQLAACLFQESFMLFGALGVLWLPQCHGGTAE